MTSDPVRDAHALLRRGFALEWLTLSWNVLGVLVLTVLAIRSASVAVAGFGLDSLIEIGASTVVIWELSGSGEQRQRRALRLIAIAFVALAGYLTVQASVALITQHHARSGWGAIVWTAVTAVVMFSLAAGKSATGRALGNRVVIAEGRVTVVDALLAVAVLIGLVLDAGLGWWWADPLAAVVIVFYAVREAITISRELRPPRDGDAPSTAA